MSSINVIDLFCGCGGLSFGFSKAGYNILLGIEIVYANDINDNACKLFEANFNLKPDNRDIRKVQCTELPEFDILTGGFPCQSFSIVAQNPKRLGVNDEKGKLFFEMCRILKETKPKCFVAEKEIMKISIIFALGLSIILTAACYLLRRQIVGAFLTEPASFDYALQFTNILLTTSFLFGVFYVLANALQAMGAASAALVINLSRQGLIYIPALFILQNIMGVTGLVWAQPLADLLSTVLVCLLYCFTLRRLMQTAPPSLRITKQQPCQFDKAAVTFIYIFLFVPVFCVRLGSGQQITDLLLLQRLFVAFLNCQAQRQAVLLRRAHFQTGFLVALFSIFGFSGYNPGNVNNLVVWLQINQRHALGNSALLRNITAVNANNHTALGNQH